MPAPRLTFLRVALTLALLVPAVGARADDSMRCGQRLVSVGDREEKILRLCGPPTTARRDYTYWEDVTVIVDTWTYDRSPNEFVRILTFESGVLRDVELGDYGR